MASLSIQKTLLYTSCVLAAGLCGWFFWHVATDDPVAGLLIEDEDEVRSTSGGPPAVPALPAVKRPRFDVTHFTGSQSCSECHSSICDSYHSHPMSRSMAKTIEASELEDYKDVTKFDAMQSASYGVQFHYEVQRTSGAVTHSEIVRETGGTELCRVDAPIEYSVGSGQRGRSYLINRDGKLYMSPITWYSEGHRWDLSPSYSKENKHFERRIVDGCVFCHAGLTNPDPAHEHTFANPAFIEPSIGCERCHGPGRAHIDFHKFKRSKTDSDPVVNPSKLEPKLRDSVCFQCHLMGVGRLHRYSKSEFDFQPGDDIANIWAIFVRGSKVDDKNSTEAVGQSEQMMVSKCYKASDGEMGCLSCHDPHLTPGVAEREEFYRQRCVNCHGDNSNHQTCSRKSETKADGVSTTSCIDCHMPKLSANDVPHTSQTDHRIPRFLSSGPIVGAESERTDLTLFGNEEGDIPEDEVAYYRGLLMVQNSEGSGDRFMASRGIPYLQNWLAKHSDDVRGLSALGSAYWLTKDFDAAKDTWESALVLDPDSELLLLRLMILCHDTGRLADGISYGERLVRVNPWHFEHHARLAHMLGQSGRLKEGIAEATEALKIAPWDFQVQGWMSEALDIIGEKDLSAKHQLLFEKLRPLDHE